MSDFSLSGYDLEIVYSGITLIVTYNDSLIWLEY